MKYLKLWKYALCPFYVSLAPYIVMSALIFNTIGCERKPSQEEITRAADLIRGQEDECKQIANDLGGLAYDYGNAGGDTWLCEVFADPHHEYTTRRALIYKEELRPITRYLA